MPNFESWSHTLIIELFRTKYERQLVENNSELSSLSYFTSQNNQQNNLIPSDHIPQMFYSPFFSIPMNQYIQNNQFNQINQFNQFNQFNQINQFNQFNQFNQYRSFPNPRFNYQQFNNNQYTKYNNNNYGNNYGFQRGNRTYRGGYYKNNRNNYNRQYQQSKNNEKENNKNKIDLNEYNKLETPEERKEYLGEIIFKAIENASIIEEKKVDIETIGKITGMILELPNRNEIFEILEDSSVLNYRIEEALNLINRKS